MVSLRFPEWLSAFRKSTHFGLRFPDAPLFSRVLHGPENRLQVLLRDGILPQQQTVLVLTDHDVCRQIARRSLEPLIMRQGFRAITELQGSRTLARNPSIRGTYLRSEGTSNIVSKQAQVHLLCLCWQYCRCADSPTPSER